MDTKLKLFKKAGINSLIYSLGNVLIMGFSVILIPFYTRYLTPSDYGIVNYLLAINAFLLPFVGLCIFQAISLKYFDFIKNPEKFKVFFTTIFCFVFLFSILFLSLILVAEYYLKILTSAQLLFYPLFFLSIITCFFSQFVQIPLRIFSCQKKALKYSLFNFLNFIIGIGLLIFFIAYLKGGALGNVKALLVRDALMVIITLFIVKKYLVFNFSASLLKKALILAVPFIPHSLSVTVLTLLDRIVLARLDTLRVVGLYSLSYQVSNILPILGGALTLSIYPIFFRLHKGGREDATPIGTRMITVAIYVFMFLALGLTVFSKELIYLLAATRYHSAYKIIPILALGGFFYFLYSMNSIRVSYLKKIYILFICSLSSAAVNLVLNILLIPHFSQLGAAIATAISYFLMFAIGSYFVHRFMPLPFRRKQLITAFILGCLLTLTGILIINQFSVSTLTIFAKIILVALFPLLVIKLRFVDISEVVNLLKKRLHKQKD